MSTIIVPSWALPLRHPTQEVEREYLTHCPRCLSPAEIEREHEFLYEFACDCGGGSVSISPYSNDVSQIAWKRRAPVANAKPMDKEPSCA